jgi:hypothetical protein
MSTLAIVLIVAGAVVLLLLILGFLGARARDRRQAGTFAEHVAQADSALEQARAADRGWDRAVMEAAARSALEQAQPGVAYEGLHLVLVDDRPGTEEDRAHFVAMGEGGAQARVILAREGDHWAAESIH